MKQLLQAALLSTLAICVLARCDCGSPVSAANSTLPAQCQVDEPQLAAQRTDILFVVDDSNSMQANQNAVAVELPAFVQALQQGSGLEQDFQIGVVTTSVYLNANVGGTPVYQEYPAESGKLRPVPSTGERLLRSTDPNLVPKFTELVKQGVFGSGQETAFEAIRLALTSDLVNVGIDQGGNGGFLRPGARLLIVIVGDEDDCSELPPRPPKVQIGNDLSVDDCYSQGAFLTPVSTYFSIFQSLDDGHGQPREVVWATIGPVARSDKRAELVLDNNVVRNADCPTSFAPGFRMHEMSNLFDPALQGLDSICNPSYHDTLVRIASLATLGQSVEVMSTSDGDLLQASVTRGDGRVDLCTVANGGIRYQAKVGEQPARIYFQNQCVRRRSDQAVSVKLLCAG